MANATYQPPPPLTANYQPPQSIGRSHRSRNIIITIVAVVLIVSLVFAAVLFMGPNNNNGNQNTPTPSPTAAQTPTRSPTATPTAPTSTPTLTPTPTPQPLNNTITAINLQFVYQSTDQGYFGANSQTLSFNNQPNGMLSIYQGQPFWYSFKLTAGSNGTHRFNSVHHNVQHLVFQ